MERTESAADIAVLVASCDAYADLWEPFFALFRRYWSDCPYPVYLGANFLRPPDPGVRSLAVGEDIDWSSGFAEMLRRVDEPYVLVMLEDYLLSAPVDSGRIGRLIEYMKARGAACMRLMPVPGPPEATADFPDAGDLPKGAPYRLSLQAAVWRRDVLLGLLRPGESPWQLEVRGTLRADEGEEPFLSVVRDHASPLPYFCTAVVRGVWLRDAVALCRRERIAVDLAVRPRESRLAYARRKLKRQREELTELFERFDFGRSATGSA
jgi:hypothetical protein